MESFSVASTQSWVFFYWKAEQKNSTIHKKKKGLFLLYKPCNRLEISLRKTPIKSVIPFKIQKFTTPHYHIITSWYLKFPRLHNSQLHISPFHSHISNPASCILALTSHISNLHDFTTSQFYNSPLTSRLSILISRLLILKSLILINIEIKS